MTRRTAVLAVLAIATSGCSTSGLDATYGKVRSVSVNGTGAFAGLLRERGHEIRTFSRLGTRLDEWAEVIVRFAPSPGPPSKEEAEWYDRWLNAVPNRMVLYVPYDFDAVHEYWSRLLNDLPPDASPRLVERVTEARDKSTNWASQIRTGPVGTTPVDAWFKVEGPKGTPLVHKTLEGPWSKGLDAAKVALPNRSSLKQDNESVLLSADGKALAIDWEHHNKSRVLVLANGAYLLNEPMSNPARLPLALKVADWLTSDDVAGENPQDFVRSIPRKIAFLEGYYVTLGQTKPKDERDHRLEIQLGLLGLAACLAAAPRLGRARPEPPSGADRPVAHPEALGALLARSGRASEARGLLETYRRWRFRTGAPTRPNPPESTAGPTPHAEPPKIA